MVAERSLSSSIFRIPEKQPAIDITRYNILVVEVDNLVDDDIMASDGRGWCYCFISPHVDITVHGNCMNLVFAKNESKLLLVYIILNLCRVGL